MIQDLIGFPCDFEITHVIPWHHNLLLAERYRDRRVFLAGDAVHLVIPSGGLGMNTGVGDAFDLAWKLAGTIHGWGGPGLLDGYERERRPIGRRNVDAAGWAAAGVPIWRALVTPDDLRRHAGGRRGARPAGRRFVRRRASAHARHGRRRGGLLLRRLAADRRRAGRPAEWETSRYEPKALPGARIPHMWLD